MLDPQALLAVTDTEPLAVPAVRVLEVVVLDPLHPAPLTDHVYEVAPGTAGIVYVAALPEHGTEEGNVTDTGAGGTDP